MARSCDELGGQKSASVWGGARLAFSLTATAQTRTHKTAGANNEIIPRGGASARVLGAKPSPFFDIFAAVCEKIGGHGGLLGRLLLANGLSFASRKPAKNGLKI